MIVAGLTPLIVAGLIGSYDLRGLALLCRLRGLNLRRGAVIRLSGLLAIGLGC